MHKPFIGSARTRWRRPNPPKPTEKSHKKHVWLKSWEVESLLNSLRFLWWVTSSKDRRRRDILWHWSDVLIQAFKGNFCKEIFKIHPRLDLLWFCKNDASRAKAKGPGWTCSSAQNIHWLSQQPTTANLSVSSPQLQSSFSPAMCFLSC